MNEATVVMAKCARSKECFGVRTEKKEGAWHQTWAFKLNLQVASREGYAEQSVSGKVLIDPEYPGCPYCGEKGWFSCGKCGKLTCHNGSESSVTCTWCGNTGKVFTADSFDLKGGGY